MTKCSISWIGDSLFVLDMHDSYMLQNLAQHGDNGPPVNMPTMMEALAQNSARPRYAFMVLNLIASIAGPDGRAGPLVVTDGTAATIRDWLCDALAPMGSRDPRRQALAARVKSELWSTGRLPTDAVAAKTIIDDELRQRIRTAGKANVSRAVSDLVRAGLLHRHYQGYRVDHYNRGARRQAVYTLSRVARELLQTARVRHSTIGAPHQDSLPLFSYAR